MRERTHDVVVYEIREVARDGERTNRVLHVFARCSCGWMGTERSPGRSYLADVDGLRHQRAWAPSTPEAA